MPSTSPSSQTPHDASHALNGPVEGASVAAEPSIGHGAKLPTIRQRLTMLAALLLAMNALATLVVYSQSWTSSGLISAISHNALPVHEALDTIKDNLSESSKLAQVALEDDSRPVDEPVRTSERVLRAARFALIHQQIDTALQQLSDLNRKHIFIDRHDSSSDDPLLQALRHQHSDAPVAVAPPPAPHDNRSITDRTEAQNTSRAAASVTRHKRHNTSTRCGDISQQRASTPRIVPHATTPHHNDHSHEGAPGSLDDPTLLLSSTLEEIDNDIRTILLLERRAIGLIDSGKPARARRLLNAIQPERAELSEHVDAMHHYYLLQIHHAIENLDTRFGQTNERIAALLALALLVGLAATWFLGRMLIEPIEKAVLTAAMLADGYRSLSHPRPRSTREAHALHAALAALDQALLHAETRQRGHTKDLQRAKEQSEQQAIDLALKSVELDEERKKAEKANHAKSQFLANMSHEIRTPMTAILGYADLLADPALDDTQRRDCIDTVQRNGKHLLSLINDILDISKIEANQLRIEAVPTRPLDVLHDVLKLLQPRAAEQRLALELEHSTDLPETLIADPLRLKQIVLNLVGNAIKFTKEGSVKVVTHADRDTDQLRVDVLDTGTGITPLQLQNIFKPFSQADGSISRRFGGTGLGLAISRRIAEAMGGTLTVQSIYGKGSCFSVTLPMHADANTLWVQPNTQDIQSQPLLPPIAMGDAANATTRARILLAEDGPDNQRLIGHVLRKAGYDVHIVGNGKLAVEQALDAERDGNPFLLILMDIQMPEMDGVTATKTLRKRGYTRPIIALTAHAMHEHQQHCLDAGCNHFATKPIDKPHLLALIQSQLAATTTKAAA